MLSSLMYILTPAEPLSSPRLRPGNVETGLAHSVGCFLSNPNLATDSSRTCGHFPSE